MDNENDNKIPTQSAAEIIRASTLQLIDVPIFNVSGLNAMSTGNEFIAVLTRVRPNAFLDGSHAPVATIEHVAMLYMSPQTAKDFSLIFQDTIRRYEEEFGVIETPHTRNIREQSDRD